MGISTFERSRHIHLWIVVERLEEELILHSGVPQPVEQILSSEVMDGKLDECTSYGHVSRTFGHVETVRSRIFEHTEI